VTKTNLLPALLAEIEELVPSRGAFILRVPSLSLSLELGASPRIARGRLREADGYVLATDSEGRSHFIPDGAVASLERAESPG